MISPPEAPAPLDPPGQPTGPADDRESPSPASPTESPRAALTTTINPPVFFTSAGLLVALLLACVLLPEASIRFFSGLKTWVVTNFGWFYILSVTFFFVFSVWLMLGRYGAIRLGADDERPAYSWSAWVAMLFAAGMGIGLVFYGVAEPIYHYASPPLDVPLSAAARANAIALTYHHWGIHAWSVYAVLALAIAYFSYRKGLPLTLRSCFYPLFGERLDGWLGHSIDIIAVFGTLFGLATSLGIGATSVSAGLHHLFGFAHDTSTQLALIAVITMAATVSLVTGVDKGIKRLSEANMILAALLLCFVFAFGPTVAILNTLVESVGLYLSHFVERSFRMGQSAPATEGKWIQDWTVVYWGWWIAWAPFVGVFVARISRGRTIREFMFTVMCVPVVITFIWFAVFGGTALTLDAAGVAVVDAVQADDATAIYTVLQALPLSTLSCFVTMLVITIFFVSSSDSASYVVDMLTSGGNPDPPIWQRVFWASAEGATAGILLYAAGSEVLTGLKAGVVAFGLPFCALIILVCFSLMKALREEESVPGNQT
jgi:choline/glycine/proline betaine transport protein